MSERFANEERSLCELFTAAARGPKRNGLFALWLLLRVAGDLFPPHAVSERAHKRRSDALVKRLTSLTLPGHLRGPLREAARAIADGSRSSVGQTFETLLPPVREALGPPTAGVLADAIRQSKQQS